MDSATSHATSKTPNGAKCPSVPEFRRLNYVYGQLLGVADFQAEQSYFREKQRLHNRCLHGFGVVCGLLVGPADVPRDCQPQSAADARDLDAQIEDIRSKRAKLAPTPDYSDCVTIDCGVALDCEGNELVVRRPLTIDLWRELGADDRKKAEGGPQTLYLSVCYCEQPVDPIRPILADQCGAVADCVYGKRRESVRVIVSLTAPQEDVRCETCCSPCGECCLLLARIDGFKHGEPVQPGAVHNEVRRRLGTYQSTVITGINWVHGAEYLRSDAEKIIGTEDVSAGIQIQFSRPVLASSLRRGVVELWRVEGGRGRSGYVTQIYGEFVDNPATGTVTQLRYRQIDKEALDYGDRIILIVRCAFILDHCCRPVDGANVGGRVPPLPNTIPPVSQTAPSECVIPPWGYAPWTSGSGSPGSNFESWIIVSDKDDKGKSAPEPATSGAPR